MGINRLKYYATVLGLSATFSLTGCSDRSTFYYTTDKDGKYILEGNMSYEKIADCKVIHLMVNGKSEIYITYKFDRYNEYKEQVRLSYKNIYNGEVIYDNLSKNSNIEFIDEMDFKDYLVYYDDVKAEYNVEEIRKIHKKIEQDLEKSKEKTNSKGIK